VGLPILTIEEINAVSITAKETGSIID